MSSQERTLVVPLRYALVLRDSNYLCLIDSVAAECNAWALCRSRPTRKGRGSPSPSF